MAYANPSETLERPTAPALVSSANIEGTSIYACDGEKLGAVHHLMIEKTSGRIRYVVMSFGGLFGLGEDCYPLPWHVLAYDAERRGYVVQVSRAVFNSDAPHFDANREPDWDGDFATQLDRHYGGVGH